MRPYPLRFTPLIKQIIWGGRRLGVSLGKHIGADSDYAESWEIVDHGEDQSLVGNGGLQGESLSSVFQNHRQWLMGEAWCNAHPDINSFPLLFKFLDCSRVLSVQVHPDDTYGATMEVPDLGKTEAWVILETTPDSVIYSGLKKEIDRPKLAELIAAGRTEVALHSFKPQPGDCVFIPAGTVHALGGGLLVAEIQQSSNTTFRLFDWNRLDANGKSRELHVESSLEVTDYTRGPVDPIRNPSVSGIEQLVSCDKFDLSRIRNSASTNFRQGCCHLISVIEGTARLDLDGDVEALSLGDCVLIPAAMEQVSINAEQGVVLQMSPAILPVSFR